MRPQIAQQFRHMATATALLLAFTPELAADLFSKDGSSSFSDRLKVLDTRAANQYAGSERYLPERVPTTRENHVFEGVYDGEWLAVAEDMARRHAVQPKAPKARSDWRSLCLPRRATWA